MVDRVIKIIQITAVFRLVRVIIKLLGLVGLLLKELAVVRLGINVVIQSISGY
jgi:hypothetical protein